MLHMKVILYMAVSADGYIADTQDETPWSDESWESFRAFVATCDVVLLGRRTYQIMAAPDEFNDGPEYLVATRDTAFDTGHLKKIIIASKDDMPIADKVGVIGGGELNGELAKLGLIDELFLDVEPITLGSGKRLFGNHDIQLNLTLAGTKKIGESTVQNHYFVNR